MIALALAAWVVWISGVFGNSGLLQAYRLSKLRHELTLRIHTLDAERQRLREQYRHLETDRYAQEQAIREVLGFVRDNEIIFEFQPSAKTISPAATATVAASSH